VERNLIAINFNNPDKSKVARNLMVALKYQIEDILEYLTSDDKEKDDKAENKE